MRPRMRRGWSPRGRLLRRSPPTETPRTKTGTPRGKLGRAIIAATSSASAWSPQCWSRSQPHERPWPRASWRNTRSPPRRAAARPAVPSAVARKAWCQKMAPIHRAGPRREGLGDSTAHGRRTADPRRRCRGFEARGRRRSGAECGDCRRSWRRASSTMRRSTKVAQRSRHAEQRRRPVTAASDASCASSRICSATPPIIAESP